MNLAWIETLDSIGLRFHQSSIHSLSIDLRLLHRLGIPFAGAILALATVLLEVLSLETGNRTCIVLYNYSCRTADLCQGYTSWLSFQECVFCVHSAATADRRRTPLCEDRIATALAV
jgi:hypothetical protein